MKRNLPAVIVFILLITLVLIGCSPGTKESPVVSEGNSDTTDAGNSPVSDDKTEYSESNYVNERFLVPGYISINDNWIYYSRIVPGGNVGGSSTYKNELRKCQIDLSQDEDVFSTEFHPWFYHPEFVLNPDDRIIYGDVDFSQSSPVSKLWIYNLHDGTIDNNILQAYGVNYGNIVLYKNQIILSIDGNETDTSTQIDTFNIDSNIEKTIFTGYVNSFGVIDDAIYFLPIYYDDENKPQPQQTIMRYDMKSETTAQVFKFNIATINLGDGVYFIPEVNYNGRNIVVQNSPNTFVYTNIDNINPKEISFKNYKELDRDQAKFIQSDDEDLYFNLSYYKNVEEGFDSSDYYRVLQGGNEPMMLNGLDSDIGEYFAAGNMYYIEYDFNTNGKLMCEKYSIKGS